MDKVNIAVVGYGMGRYHCGLISKVEGLNLLGVSDLDEAKRARAVAEYPGIKTYNDLEETLKDKSVDIVTLCLPHHIHEKTWKCVRCGCAWQGAHCQTRGVAPGDPGHRGHGAIRRDQ